jgi:ATP-binding cassette, subfamily B, bacterial HlyB/CyaB
MKPRLRSMAGRPTAGRRRGPLGRWRPFQTARDGLLRLLRSLARKPAFRMARPVLRAAAGLAWLVQAPARLTRRLGRRLRVHRPWRPKTAGRALPPAAPAIDSLARAFEQLCRQLGRPFSAAEIRAAAPPSESGMTLGNLLLAAERLGFKAAEFKADAKSLAQMPPPFLVLGRRPGEGWLAEARIRDHLVLREAGAGVSALDLKTVADLAERVVLLKALAEPASRREWRDTIMRRLRPVLWELGIASVVINFLALATPLFLMTVYNKVINHGALQTLDVLALGMITLFVFEWMLRSLRSYVASHTGGRLDAALGSEVIHHLVHLPLGTFEAVPTGQILERTR